ncbi:CheR family methyltransferase [Pseudomonas anguilliseptica]|uniref:Chemotaxis protein methyltransferase n=1 Tax=Pseudomonas anguilliseptica TaxID=53406 RepID=A0A1H4YYM8_PSEAG|nr:CheR family methyltransferase [Pseudomonas anguilliseptica]SED22140.1 chemotaxis protein methyltransferase CheR [Pseudomonas anguilliseptica]
MSEPMREFHYRADDFQKVRSLLHKRSGISLSESKSQMVYSRLARRLRQLDLNSFTDYFGYLNQHEGEWQEFVNALTTNLTSFFRENHHFDALTSYLRHLPKRTAPVRIWCSAASTGEEPYSLAITAMEAFNSLHPPVQILASDIDTSVLDTAREGIYPFSRVEQLSDARKKTFFMRGTGTQAGLVRVRSELRELIEFQQINLLGQQWPIRPGLDIIFCRNVMIYFDKPTQQHLLTRMVKLLRQDGLFFAGHSESFVHATHLVRLIGHTVYRPVSHEGDPA